jgi:hypothetical protein
MSAFASFSVNDRETTPVSHTFAPQERKDGLASFIEAGTVPSGNKKVTVSWRTLSDGRRRVRLTMVVPVEVTETINGVDYTKPYTGRLSQADVTFTFGASTTQQDRDNVVGMFANSLDASVTVIDDTVAGLEGIY